MRLLIVEDEKRLADTLRQLLHRQGYTADVSYDGVSGLDNAMSGIYDLVILDVMLPGMNGFQVAQKLRQGGIVVPVLMLTAKSTEYDKVLGLDGGADDYVTKPFGTMELIARVKALLRRADATAAADTEDYHNGALYLDPAKHIIQVNGKDVVLTLKEFQLLCYLVKNKGNVMTRDRILQEIWGYEFDGENRTVDVHIRTLRTKLGEAGSLVETVRGIGYRIGGRSV